LAFWETSASALDAHVINEVESCCGRKAHLSAVALEVRIDALQQLVQKALALFQGSRTWACQQNVQRSVSVWALVPTSMATDLDLAFTGLTDLLQICTLPADEPRHQVKAPVAFRVEARECHFAAMGLPLAATTADELLACMFFQIWGH
jgi:hypothetical protein